MKKNTFSLLNSNWMFSGDSNSILMPYLLNILNSRKLQLKDSLPETTFKFISKTGMGSAMNSNEIPKQDSVVVLNVHHPIFKYDQECGPRGTQTIINMLDSWKKEESILGVVIDYNSGGGQASGCAEIAEYIHNYPKPIVGFSKDIVGSGAYYMYAASKHTFIHPHADFVGSVGTMYYKIDMEGVIENAGGKVLEIYSDLSPEKNNATRELKKGNDRPLIEQVLNPLAQDFHRDIKKFRPNITEKALRGDVFRGDEIIKQGLADEIGTLQTAIDKVFELSQSSNSKPNTNMSKQRAKVQAVLGLDAPLASTDNGSYLNEEQLDAIETHIETMEADNATLTTQLEEAQNNTELTEQLTTATTRATALETSVDAMLTEAGVSATGTLEEKVAALGTKVSAMAKADGATHTVVKTDAKPIETKVVQLDASASHNQMADQLKN